MNQQLSITLQASKLSQILNISMNRSYSNSAVKKNSEALTRLFLSYPNQGPYNMTKKLYFFEFILVTTSHVLLYHFSVGILTFHIHGVHIIVSPSTAAYRPESLCQLERSSTSAVLRERRQR
jgi:hypothetical protein